MIQLDIREILNILLHRYPFVMIDRVLDLNDNTILALKNFSFNEPYAQGHFPNNPIMPGVMMVESMAQASAILTTKFCEKNMDMKNLLEYAAKGTGILFTSADEVRFKKVVKPGDQLKIKSTLIRQARNLFSFATQITVDELIVAEAKLKAIYGP
jgi:3-hydroxyacyl-[acyl-carrier-protein] dehydratase